MIRETIVTTRSRGGAVHIAPLGLIEEADHLIIAPFKPSQTLDNLRENPFAVANYVDDVRIFAGCLTGRRDWPTRSAAPSAAWRTGRSARGGSAGCSPSRRDRQTDPDGQ